MAGIKISALPVIPSSQLTDIGPFVQGGITYQASLSQITTLINANIQLSSVAQVTGLPTALASFVPLAGGTMTGPLILSGSPTTPLQAADKAYVDTVASGFTVILACAAATTANLNATYSNGAAGVGATLTNAGANAAFVVDGYSANVNDRILVKNQTSTANNGVYSVNTVGNGSTPWVLTRTTDYDIAPGQIHPGTLVAVNNGTVNGTTSWLETATVNNIGTDPILFSQFTFAPGAFLLVANNLSELTVTAATARANLGLTAAAIMTLPVSPANGGTGVNNGSSTITLGGSLTFSGAFTTAFTVTGNTALTLPTSGTLLTGAQPTINQPNIVGVTNGSNAAAGSVGEIISSVIASGAAVSLTSNTPRNVTSILLTPGDWDISGNVTFLSSGGTTITIAWCSLTSATLPDASLFTEGNGSSGLFTPYLRVNVTINTTVFLSCRATITSGSCSGCGGIYASRVR